MKTLSGKVAIVTGASSGIGKSTALLFAKQGAKIIVGARRENELNHLVQEVVDQGGCAQALPGDVRSEQYNEALVDLALQSFGRLDIAFNNAGILGSNIAATQLSLKEWNQILEINLTGCFLGAKYQIPAMMENGGSIIFSSSFVGPRIGMPNKAAYAASKAGIIGLTRALATEYGEHRVRVNAILPGATATPMTEEFGTAPEVIQFVKDIHALKRIASADEIAQSVLYLASDHSSFTTGSELLVDGGVSICKT